MDNLYYVFMGDYGGTVYLTVPAHRVRCRPAALDDLLSDIDALCWGEGRGTALFALEPNAIGSFGGGMGGGEAAGRLWLHPSIAEPMLRREVKSVLRGRLRRVRKDRIDLKAWRASSPP